MNEISLVTGANGHLGYNLCKILLEKGENVIATYRNPKNRKILSELGCKTLPVDIMDKNAMIKAFYGVTNIYAVAASFKMWSKNPKKDIYDNNVEGTRKLFEAANESGVKNIVYVSSVASLDFTKLPAKESNGYNTDRRNWYYNSKNDSDKLALELGKKFNIRTVLILPSAMIGSKAHQLSYSNRLVKQILDGEMIADTNITLNWIDVKDVALGAYSAMKKGRNGERYILANETHTSIQESVAIAAKTFPELKLKTPPKIPKPLLYIIAFFMKTGSLITGKEPLLQKEYIDMFYGLKQDYDINKAKSELNFTPKSSKKALIEALNYIKNEWNH
ncbi:NAD-dependent epimerase/dehydratase family protein [Tenacibaculum sp. ZS6-P6]|uniref:NAD-dependent epimerase/dehydratase family protein n=1 Tax=Tenacibaculum sp. ZS6-P6 TaxID=3447503 RepID=UPI003F9722C3